MANVKLTEVPESQVSNGAQNNIISEQDNKLKRISVDDILQDSVQYKDLLSLENIRTKSDLDKKSVTAAAIKQLDASTTSSVNTLTDSISAVNDSIGNGELSIIHNGEHIGTFSANQKINTTVNINQKQSNWTQTDQTKPDYIKNKPSVNDGKLIFKKGGRQIGQFSANQELDTTINMDDMYDADSGESFTVSNVIDDNQYTMPSTKAVHDALLQKTSRHIFTIAEDGIYDEDGYTKILFSDIIDIMSNTKDFVFIAGQLDNNGVELFYPRYRDSESLIFESFAIKDDNNYQVVAMIRVNSDDTIDILTSYGESASNKVDTITEVNRNSSITYPSTKAVYGMFTFDEETNSLYINV